MRVKTAFSFQGTCPICGEKSDRYHVAEAYCEAAAYSMILCPNCGGEFSWPMKPMDYEDDPSKYQLYVSRYDSMLRESLRRNFCYSYSVTFLNCLEDKGKVLDIGVGLGFFLTHAYNLGFKVYGIEISKHSVDFLRKMLPFAQIALGKEVFDLPENWSSNYEVISALDVLEHARMPLELGRRIHSLLAPGGYFLMTVPNRNRYYYRFHRLIDDFFPQGDYPPYHLTRWRKKTVETFLKKSGFKEYCLFPGGLLWRKNLFVNGKLSRWLSSVPRGLYKLSPRMPLAVTRTVERLGTHLIAVARKDEGNQQPPLLANMAEKVLEKAYRRSIPFFVECEIT